MNIEEKIVFAVTRTEHDGCPMLVIGIPKGAWEYMRDGKTHHFDLNRVGFPFKLMMFGADDHSAAVRVIEQAAANVGQPLLDMRREDFAIKDKP